MREHCTEAQGNDWSALTNEDLQRSYDEAQRSLDEAHPSEKWAHREILGEHRAEARRRGLPSDDPPPQVGAGAHQPTGAHVGAHLPRGSRASASTRTQCSVDPPKRVGGTRASVAGDPRRWDGPDGPIGSGHTPPGGPGASGSGLWPNGFVS